MIGIIYKLTIVAKYKMDDYKPFYIGQHWCESKNDFLDINYPYYGSGRIWKKYINSIKSNYPNKWKHFIKREILCIVKEDNQKTLDKLEEYYIQKYKSHYSFRKGGCNILWGTANQFGSGSPAKDPIVREKISKSRLGTKTDDKLKRYFHFLFLGNKNPFYGKRHSEETRKKISEFRKSLPPKYKVGDIHPNKPNMIWTEYSPGKFDWRAKDRKLSYAKEKGVMHHTEETKNKLRIIKLEYYRKRKEKLACNQ